MKCEKCNGSMVRERGTVGQPDELKCIGCGKRVLADAAPAPVQKDRSDRGRLFAIIHRDAPVNRTRLMQTLKWSAEKVNEVASELIAAETIAPWPTFKGGCLYTIHGAPDPRMSDPARQESSGPREMRARREKAADKPQPSPSPAQIESAIPPPPERVEEAPVAAPRTDARATFAAAFAILTARRGSRARRGRRAPGRYRQAVGGGVMPLEFQSLDGTNIPPGLADALRQLTTQLLIVAVKRAGGRLVVPVAEVDDTAQDLVEFQHEGPNFIFVLRRKS